jgi:hypothetical protein
VLTPFDDYPIHQTSQPLAVASSADANHYDRFFFNGYTADGSLYFGVALGLYPNREVIDAAFSVVHGGQQVSVFASGRCPLDHTQTAVGPIRVEIVEPMRTLRVIVDAPDHGLAAELTFRARTRPVQEPPFRVFTGTRLAMDYTRLTQWGAWEGWCRVDGTRIECSPSEVLGSRDRSWGVRGVGERPAGPPAASPQFFWLWAPVNFSDVCTHFDVNEYGDGRRWHETGVVVPVGDGEPSVMRAVDYRISWRPGTRRAASFELDLVPWDGPTRTLRLDPVLDFQMLGIGYFHPEWGHGMWKGDLAVGGQRWSLPVADPLVIPHLHIQTLCRARLDGQDGVGVLEQIVLGPHAPTGLTGIVDPWSP